MSEGQILMGGTDLDEAKVTTKKIGTCFKWREVFKVSARYKIQNKPMSEYCYLDKTSQSVWALSCNGAAASPDLEDSPPLWLADLDLDTDGPLELPS